MEVEKEFSKKAKKDFELIEKATKNNDQKAFGQLMMRYRRPVYHMIMKMVRDEQDAEDLTIETFAKAFRNLNKFNPSFTFSTWLFRIATNHCIDFIRKKRIETTSFHSAYVDDDGEDVGIDVKDTELDPENAAIRQQKIDIMRLIVENLPEKYQVLVRLRYFEELSYEEISEEIGAPLGTVKAQLHRAREILHGIVKDKRDNI